MGFEKLIEKIVETQNPTVVGLDPKLDYLPEFLKDEAFKMYGENLKGAAKAILKYNKMIIDQIYDIVPAIKPQAAYYEMFGYQGVKTLAKTIQYAKEKGIYVITDGKRNDIGSTMEAYATAHLGEIKIGNSAFEPFGADALTVNGYLGTDGISPLLGYCKNNNKGIFVLVKTSNPSSGEFQDRLIDGQPLYSLLGEKCEEWGEETIGKYGYSAVGAVVGATYPKQLVEMRKKLPHTFFLVPGYGAQGGKGEDIKNAFDDKGLGAIINSSRDIMCAYKKDEKFAEEDFALASRAAAIRMQKDIISHIGKISL